MGIIRSINIDPIVDLALKSKPEFNVSKFCNEALKKALDIKDTDIPKEEKELDIRIAEQRIKLQMLESKKDELSETRKKEENRWKEAK